MGDSSDMLNLSWIGRIHDKLFDNRALACVVDDVETGSVASMRRPDLNTERMEIMIWWVVLHCNSVGFVSLYT